jgi:Cobalamin synthesis protein cobW C-terminal domain
MYPPRWLDAWPDGDQTSRLVFIVRDIAPEVILARFAAGDPSLNVNQGGQ